MGDPLSGLFGAIGGAAGYAASGKQLAAEQKAIDDEKTQYTDLEGVEGMKYIPGTNTTFAQAGIANPGAKKDYSTINAQTAGPNAYGDIRLDPATRAAQMTALGQLSGIASAGGMDPASQARLQQAQMSNAQQARSNTDAALERAQSEGRLNSGRALSAQMQAGQGAANANAMAGTQAAGDASNRALQAIAQTGQFGGQINAQDYGQQANQAQAQNLINQFNATQNQQAQQQTFQNRFGVAGGAAAGDAANADFQNRQIQQNMNTGAGIGSAVGAVGDMAMKGMGI